MPPTRSSSTDSFKSTNSALSASLPTAPSPTAPPDGAAATAADADNSYKYPAAEEAALVAESNAHKATANAFFGSRDFSSAIQTYDKALGALPHYLDYEVAVLKANIAACHLKLEEWKLAVEAATAAAQRLEVLDPIARKAEKSEKGGDTAGGKNAGEDAASRRRREAKAAKEVEKDDAGAVEEVDDATAAAYERLAASGHTYDEVQRLRIKVLLRRAKARTRLGSWADLSGAEEDYKTLLGMHGGLLTGMDRSAAERELRALTPRLDEAKQREMSEMMGKLKDLGNGLLKPFGLSTDMFNFVKDEKTGGYSMNINQGGKAS